MHAMVRRDAGGTAAAETLVKAGRALAVELSRVPGFVSHAAFLAEDGALVSISFCEDAAGLEAVGGLLAGWVPLNLPGARQHADVHIGELIIQRGL